MFHKTVLCWDEILKQEFVFQLIIPFYLYFTFSVHLFPLMHNICYLIFFLQVLQLHIHLFLKFLLFRIVSKEIFVIFIYY